MCAHPIYRQPRHGNCFRLSQPCAYPGLLSSLRDVKGRTVGLSPETSPAAHEIFLPGLNPLHYLAFSVAAEVRITKLAGNELRVLRDCSRQATLI